MHLDSDFDDDEPTRPVRIRPRARMLLAEDDDDLRQIIAGRMRRDGFEVLEASSGLEALDLLAAITRAQDPTDAIDLLVSDVRMPGCSGIDIARELRTQSQSTPVLLITSHPDAGVLAEARALHADVLRKPFRLERLSEAALAAIEPHGRS